MTCDEVRELLPEHLLGTLEGPEDLDVRRHLRGCAGCRAETASLGEGVAAFARAAHDRPPPPGLRHRVLTVLEEEWRDHSSTTPSAARRPWLGWAAAIVLVGALAWGGAQTWRATLAAGDAASYRNLLQVLGGDEFRLGELVSTGPERLEGSVVLYDSHVDQSWAVVLVRAAGMRGAAEATLRSRDGRAIEMSLEFDETGHASTWWAGADDLRPFDELEVATPDGHVVATARIAPA